MRIALSVAALLVSGAAMAQPQTGDARVVNLAGKFVEVWDRNAGRPEADFVKDFRNTIEPGFPEFYGIERYAGKKTREQRDREIGEAFREFGPMRAEYVQKTEAFAGDLPKHIGTFMKHFPDYTPSTIYLIHALGEMDGGKRTLDGKTYFIFGPDSMVKYHAKGSDPTPFFHHELFHDYHPLKCEGRKVWTYLWIEGLATYVGKTLTPNASIAEMSLNIPENMVPGVRAQPEKSWADLLSRLDQGAGPSYDGLFRNLPDGSGLPARRGYYLGYLVAREVGRKYTLKQLAALDCDQVREEVFAAVERLRNKPIE